MECVMVWNTGDSTWYQLDVPSKMLPMILTAVPVEKLLNKATQAINAPGDKCSYQGLGISQNTAIFYKEEKAMTFYTLKLIISSIG